MTFSTFSFDERILACVKACGYTEPTPIQQQTIPLILKDHDVMGLAQTGTGKTAAFALPILQRLLTRKAVRKGPKVLVLAPTRELAIQINENFTALSRNTGIRSAVVIGGVGMGPQIKAFDSCDIIVACPGRLVRLMQKQAAKLGAIEALVLDEADRMLDMGFMPDIRRILAALPAKRQNLLFSATMPDSIRTFAKGILVAPKTVKIDTATPVAGITHTVYETHNEGKAALLEQLIRQADHQNMLIFTRTKYKAKNLSRKLAKNGHSATFLQGNMSQSQRERALKGFRSGRYSIMVATDIAARGIDCDRVTHVINFDMPDTVETYTHRIGRTGRAGRSGHAISLATRDDAAQLRAIRRVMQISVERQADDASDAIVQNDAARPRRNRPNKGQTQPRRPRTDAAKRPSGNRRSSRRRKAA